MSEYIERETAINAMLHRFWDGKETLREIMNSVPAADVAPVVRAKWYVAEWNHYDGSRADSFYCGNCHCVEPFIMRYCPNCGAKMENGEHYTPRTLKDIAENYPPDGPMNHLAP